MEILGLQPITLTLIICLVGILLRVYIGKIKHSETKFSINAAILSFMVGILVSVGLVAPVIDVIPNDSDDIVILPLIAGQIIIVMKSESISTAARNLIKPKTFKSLFDITESKPIDDVNDLPPGKDTENKQ